MLREPQLGGISQSFRELPPELRAMAREPRLLVLTKANARATVHRPGYLDYIGVKRFDAKGNVVGERRFVGLYTSSGYHADPSEVPLLRRKVARVVERSGFRQYSHMYKNLLSILQDYPRDELFQIDEDTLLDSLSRTGLVGLPFLAHPGARPLAAAGHAGLLAAGQIDFPLDRLFGTGVRPHDHGFHRAQHALADGALGTVRLGAGGAPGARHGCRPRRVTRRWRPPDDCQRDPRL